MSGSSQSIRFVPKSFQAQFQFSFARYIRCSLLRPWIRRMSTKRSLPLLSRMSSN